MGNAPLRIQLLGGFAVSRAGRPVPPQAWRLRKAKSLIKLLALAHGHRAVRSEIGELLWPERSEAAVANNCAQALHAARRALEACGADGAFRPFSPARLAELYPTREVYVDRVRRAADRLLAERHILRADRDAYIAAAEHQR